jgi:hypothetical protein
MRVQITREIHNYRLRNVGPGGSESDRTNTRGEPDSSRSEVYLW